MRRPRWSPSAPPSSATLKTATSTTLTNADSTTATLAISNIVPTSDSQAAAISATGLTVDTNANAIAYSRTTGQVLNIAYITSAAATAGGFFPAGVNGTIATSTAN